ncbi:hypothetical protein SAMN05660652_02715 [Propionivibrio dicarboxylicus]|uniref:Alpha/beta hydrolase domain-containing protein n=1 Tax=Propionivibrio dicarboxylicus TaxID=83767 RepID=A0A1G8H248_9RHOO|nr:hypothetical protein SAMN05660652_02715 [Propionivibrio dicarboxylicus]
MDRNHPRAYFPTRIVAVTLLLVSLSACSGLGQKNSATAGAAPSIIEKLEITSRKPAFSGQVFGDIGPYEFVAGVATVRVDPKHSANQAVVDLDKAVDPDGFVRFKTDLVVLRPVVAEKSSRVLIVDIPNRGNKLLLARLADGSNQFETSSQAGNGWPMRQGHTFAWIGWQGDVPLGTGGQSVGMQPPVAKNGLMPITGTSVEEFIFDKEETKSLGVLTYPAASTDTTKAELTVRATISSPPRTLAPSAWRYVDTGRIEITRPDGFDAGAIYQLTYEARDPKVMGLGMVALRDVTAFLKGNGQDADASKPSNPIADIDPNLTVLVGISQSGRFLRDFIWYGFNEALDGKKIFDAAMPIIAGSRKSYVNVRFAQPGRYSRQHEDHFYYGDQFPFTYATTTDPISGKTDGIFSRCEKNATCPKLMHLDSSLEFWQARASLLVVDGQGRSVPVPENVRLYLMAGTQHGPATKPEYGICQQLSNPATQTPMVRAVMARLIDWTRNGKMPPASRFPSLEKGLAEPTQASIGFPNLNSIGLSFPGVFNSLYVVNHKAAPAEIDFGKPYKLLLPRTDSDGHDIDGVRLPEIEVPLATHTGWGLRKSGFAEGQLCGISGTYSAFAKDAAERAGKNDPRPSVAERYKTRGAYLEQYSQAGRRLLDDGFLLDEDLARLIDHARQDPRIAHLPQ